MKHVSKIIFCTLLALTSVKLITNSHGETDSIEKQESEEKINQPASFSIAGTWKREDGWFFIFNDDGTFTHVSPQKTPPGNGWESGKWEKVGETKLLVTCRTGDFINLVIVDRDTLFCTRNKQNIVNASNQDKVEEIKSTENNAISKTNLDNFQERIWTSTQGGKITARAVSKSDTGVILKYQDGKRVEVALAKLSPEDVEWVKKWIAPTFTVSAEIDGGHIGLKYTQMRMFTFSSSSGESLEIYEKKLPYLIPALQKVLELGKIDRSDVEGYQQQIPVGKPIGYSYEDKEVIFKIEDGKAFCSGLVGTIPIEEIPSFIDFIEKFSVREWDEKKENIKRRFE
jgi:hypothetical protein